MLDRRATLGVLGLGAAAWAPIVRATGGATTDPFRLVGAAAPVPVLVDPVLARWVQMAADHLRGDVAAICGRVPASRSEAGPALLIATADSPWLRARAPALAAFGELLAGQREAFAIRAVNGCAAIVGSDVDGVRRGIYAFAREMLGVDPLHRFTGIAPRRRDEIEWPVLALDGPSPRVALRGWFLNDEDLLTEWYDSAGRRRIDYPFYNQVIAPEALDAVLETAVRSGVNTIIPASFVDIRNPVEKALLDQAAAAGLWLHQHHIEPIGVSAFGYNNYWRDRGETPPPFSYLSSRPALERIWTDYAERWSGYDRVIWSLGHRGVADRPLWMADPAVPRDDAGVGKVISDAIAFQRDTVLRLTRGKRHELATSLWAEGSALMAGGHLRIADDVIVMFADNGPGFRLQDDFYARRASVRRAGIYYHHQIWGSGPHLVQATPPARTSAVLGDALAAKADQFVLVNAGNVREFAAGLSITAALLENGERANVDAALIAACGRWFGEQDAVAGARLYRALFDAHLLDPAVQRPVLLDGLIRQRGQALLDLIESGRPVANDHDDADTRNFVERHLRDMRNVELSDAALLVLVARQRAGFALVRDEANGFAEHIGGAGAIWVRSSIIVQAAIMLALLDWLAAIVRARARAGDRAAQAAELERAVDALEDGVANRSVQPAPFRNWYRGDRKMNLPAMIERTRAVRAGLRAAVTNNDNPG